MGVVPPSPGRDPACLLTARVALPLSRGDGQAAFPRLSRLRAACADNLHDVLSFSIFTRCASGQANKPMQAPRRAFTHIFSAMARATSPKLLVQRERLVHGSPCSETLLTAYSARRSSACFIEPCKPTGTGRPPGVKMRPETAGTPDEKGQEILSALASSTRLLRSDRESTLSIHIMCP